VRRAKIRAKIEAGQLPRDLPSSTGFGRIVGVRYGASAEAPCSGCDERIDSHETSVGQIYSSGISTCFHEECARIWEEERQRPI
jgi:hypothetical protein